MARKKNVTFNDIAQYTHFSKTTISRYFNNPDSLTPENQQIISDALDKLNYKENKVAKIHAIAFATKTPRLIFSVNKEYTNKLMSTVPSPNKAYSHISRYL